MAVGRHPQAGQEVGHPRGRCHDGLFRGGGSPGHVKEARPEGRKIHPQPSEQGAELGWLTQQGTTLLPGAPRARGGAPLHVTSGSAPLPLLPRPRAGTRRPLLDPRHAEAATAPAQGEALRPLFPAATDGRPQRPRGGGRHAVPSRDSGERRLKPGVERVWGVELPSTFPGSCLASGGRRWRGRAGSRPGQGWGCSSSCPEPWPTSGDGQKGRDPERSGRRPQVSLRDSPQPGVQRALAQACEPSSSRRDAPAPAACVTRLPRGAGVPGAGQSRGWLQPVPFDASCALCCGQGDPVPNSGLARSLRGREKGTCS